MKKVIGLIASFLVFSSFAGITLDIDFKNNESGKMIKFKRKVKTAFDETKTFKIPDSNKQIEIKVTDKIPTDFKGVENAPDQVFVEMKIVEVLKGQKNIISSPQVISTFGQESSMEVYEESAPTKMVMHLKVTPQKL